VTSKFTSNCEWFSIEFDGIPFARRMHSRIAACRSSQDKYHTTYNMNKLTMKIGIVGSGNTGCSPGKQGHEVFSGARSTEKGRAVADLHDMELEEVRMTKPAHGASC
jgi:hypothetical protein